jgi:hypothetical protein
VNRRLAALYAMAQQDESPKERDIAIAMLESKGMWPPPPKPPTRNAAPAPMPQPMTNFWTTFSTSGSVNITFTSTFRSSTTEW